MTRDNRMLEKQSEAQNHRCAYCGCFTKLPLELDSCVILPDNAATLDHYVPRARGGKDGRYNMVMACNYCNNMRGDIGADHFYQSITKKIPTKILPYTDKSKIFIRQGKKLVFLK